MYSKKIYFFNRKLFFFSFLCIAFQTNSEELEQVPEVYKNISDIYNPTLLDLHKIQEYITFGNRPIIERLGDKKFILHEFKMIGESLETQPEFGFFAINSKENKKENCIITYSSFNENYPRGVRRLVEAIHNSDFKGHIYYRIGGWPNIANGDLVLAHVPFAFKVCFFREVQQMGYKRVLWIDSAVLPSPFVSLNKIFQIIKNKGFFVQGNTHSIGPYINKEAARAFGLTLEQTQDIPSCSAAILGVDFTQPKAIKLIEKWFAAAKDPDAFYSSRFDQNALSIIFYQMRFKQFLPITTLGHPKSLNKQHLFIMDRDYVKNTTK